jgi:hypothetical protein
MIVGCANVLGMANIKLTQGQIAVFDDEDAEILCGYKWYANKNRNTYYARTPIYVCAGKCEYLYMHRLLMCPGNGLVVDHINGDGLDNRRQNMRVCRPEENSRNRIHRANKEMPRSSKYLGVYLDRGGKWAAELCHKGVRYYLGRFSVEEEAAAARMNAELVICRY